MELSCIGPALGRLGSDSSRSVDDIEAEVLAESLRVRPLSSLTLTTVSCQL